MPSNPLATFRYLVLAAAPELDGLCLVGDASEGLSGASTYCLP